METFEEFIAGVEKAAAAKQDQGLGYDVAAGILEALHARLVALESRLPAATPAK